MPRVLEEFPGAEKFLPPRASLTSLSAAMQRCHGCPLYQHATQAVGGAGRRSSRLMLVGEQPGNDEDLAGAPFVGPAGRLLDEALDAAGIDRDDAYLTNVVKHFKWEPRGKRRIHQKPNAREVTACLPWLEKEIELIEPHVLVCLGATAAQALFGPRFRVTVDRGRWLESRFAANTMATVHPSSVLRQRTADDRAREMKRLIADLKLAARRL